MWVAVIVLAAVLALGVAALVAVVALSGAPDETEDEP